MKLIIIPKRKVLVRDIKELPKNIRVHTKVFGIRVVKVGYEGLPGQCFACKEMDHMAKHLVNLKCRDINCDPSFKRRQALS